MTRRAVLFASGTGSNVKALLEAHSQAASPSWSPVLLIADRDDALVLHEAQARGVPTRVVPAGDDFEVRLRAVLDDARADLLLLAGYLRLIPAGIVRHWSRRILNVHPSLLPAFGGKGMYGRRIHEAVLAAGVQVTGVTVHLVDERFDEGPILAQWPVAVRPDDTPDTLAARVLEAEHRLYPRVVEQVAAQADPRPLSPSDLTPTRLVFP